MNSLTFLPPSNFAVFDCLYFLCYCSRELKIAQTVQINQLFQLLNLTCTYSGVFCGLTCMLMSKNVNNDVSRIRLLMGYTNMANVTSSVITFLT